ncbi:MAG: sigma-70 family RNA polymerase sigma factor [Flavobacteriales bacterium]|nr:sigma-70 family RNA polymerase sigma factor [Flavobacteriales bacterium]
MSDKNDQHYIDQVLNGNTDAFSELVSRYKDMVFTLALRVVKQREEAEEVSQEVFLKAYKHLKKFKGNSKFSSWLYRITYNASMDSLKQQKRMVDTENFEQIRIDEIEQLDTQLDQLEERERKSAIQRSIDLLAAEDGFLLTLYYFDELKIDEIASLTKLSKSNIKVKLFRARNRLSQILMKQLDSEYIGEYGK